MDVSLHTDTIPLSFMIPGLSGSAANPDNNHKSHSKHQQYSQEYYNTNENLFSCRQKIWFWIMSSLKYTLQWGIHVL